jgi:hypothetical protein
MSYAKRKLEEANEEKEQSDWAFFNEVKKQHRDNNWNKYQEKILPELKKKLDVTEFQWHCKLKKDEYIVDFYPKKNRVCVKREGEKGQTWYNGGIGWIRKNLLKK